MSGINKPPRIRKGHDPPRGRPETARPCGTSRIYQLPRRFGVPIVCSRYCNRASGLRFASGAALSELRQVSPSLDRQSCCAFSPPRATSFCTDRPTIPTTYEHALLSYKVNADDLRNAPPRRWHLPNSAHPSIAEPSCGCLGVLRCLGWGRRLRNGEQSPLPDRLQRATYADT